MALFIKVLVFTCHKTFVKNCPCTFVSFKWSKVFLRGCNSHNMLFNQLFIDTSFTIPNALRFFVKVLSLGVFRLFMSMIKIIVNWTLVLSSVFSQGILLHKRVIGVIPLTKENILCLAMTPLKINPLFQKASTKRSRFLSCYFQPKF